MKKVLGFILGVSLMLGAAPVFANDFSQCVACHGATAGGGTGPALKGQSKEDLVAKANGILDGTREPTTNMKALIPAMKNVMLKLNDGKETVVAGSGLDKALDFAAAQ